MVEVREVEHIYAVFDSERLPGPLNALLAMVDRVLGRFGHPHFFTVDMHEFCGHRLVEGDGKLWFECEGEGIDWNKRGGGA